MTDLFGQLITNGHLEQVLEHRDRLLSELKNRRHTPAARAEVAVSLAEYVKTLEPNPELTQLPHLGGLLPKVREIWEVDGHLEDLTKAWAAYIVG